jgi:hydrolase, TatD family
MDLILFDSHAHLNSGSFSESKAREIRERAAVGGVVGVLNVGYDLKNSERAVRQSEALGGTWAAVGMHPHEAKNYSDDVEAKFRELAAHPKVVAIGEMGLDYYYDHSPREVQREVFIRQMNLAREVGLPIIIHDRDAHGECLELVKAHGKGLEGVFHCFSGSKEFAREVLDLGFYLSFAGPMTYKNAVSLKEVAKWAPADRILIETDCPYLTPVPHRGKQNEPLFVGYVAEEVAALRGISPIELARVATENTCRLFGIEL